jgi:hypothetical protein
LFMDIQSLKQKRPRLQKADRDCAVTVLYVGG